MFFLDEAVALAAGHRPCATCRRDAYRAYRDAVTCGVGAPVPLLARQLDGRLRAERLHRGRGLVRGPHRRLWEAAPGDLPDGTVVVDDADVPHLLVRGRALRFTSAAWVPGDDPLPASSTWRVLTPPTSVLALAHGHRPLLHPSSGHRVAGPHPGPGSVASGRS